MVPIFSTASDKPPIRPDVCCVSLVARVDISTERETWFDISLIDAESAPDPLAGISPREREVLGLLLDGMPNKLIARRLEISEKTVKSHLTSIFRVIGVNDRVQAILWVERHGLRRELGR